MSSNHIPIVQGVAVPPKTSDYHSVSNISTQPMTFGSNNSNYYHVADISSSSQQQQQQSPDSMQQLRAAPIKQYQDVIWAILFVLHLMGMIGFIAYNLMNPVSVTNEDGSSSATTTTDVASFNGKVIFLTGITGGTAVALSVVSLSFMMQHAEFLVQVGLLFSVATSLVIAVVGFMMGSIMMGVIGLISFVVGLCYIYVVWSRIPFAAANLNTALSAVRANMGLAVISFFVTIIAFGWTVLWFLGVGGAYVQSNGVVIFILFLSYYWVHQVLQNTMHVTTAGVIGTWWWVPTEASSFWSTALSDSFARATTYSFGSICFGSLLVAIVQALRALEYQSRDNDDMQILRCIIQCILACIESIIEELNRWAYVYVGLYGFSYLEAGRNVIQLFQNKGWTAIITDDLADNVLFMMTIAISLASGIVGLLIGLTDSSMFMDLGLENAAAPAFFIGFITGFLFSTIIMSVVGSGVNTVIVCFAEDPAAFEQNHPQLSSEMRVAWTKAYPDLNY